MFPVCAPASLAMTARSGRRNSRRIVRSGGSFSIARSFSYSSDGRHGKECAAAPQSELLRSVSLLGHRHLHEIVVERARDEGLQPTAHVQVGFEALATRLHG